MRSLFDDFDLDIQKTVSDYIEITPFSMLPPSCQTIEFTCHPSDMCPSAAMCPTFAGNTCRPTCGQCNTVGYNCWPSGMCR